MDPLFTKLVNAGFGRSLISLFSFIFCHFNILRLILIKLISLNYLLSFLIKSIKKIPQIYFHYINIEKKKLIYIFLPLNNPEIFQNKNIL